MNPPLMSPVRVMALLAAAALSFGATFWVGRETRESQPITGGADPSIRPVAVPVRLGHVAALPRPPAAHRRAPAPYRAAPATTPVSVPSPAHARVSARAPAPASAPAPAPKPVAPATVAEPAPAAPTPHPSSSPRPQGPAGLGSFDDSG